LIDGCDDCRSRSGIGTRDASGDRDLNITWLLVKDRLAVERARNLDVVIFDKTGTLTRGSPAVSEVFAAPGFSEDDVMALSAAVESDSEHPVAKAIVAEAKQKNDPKSRLGNRL